MKVRTIGVLSVVGIAMSITPIWAGPVGGQRSVSADDQQAVAVRQLEAQRYQVARAMQGPPQNKGPALIRNMGRASQLDNLINRLKSGQPVSPDEIDQALQPANP
jgi:hypothetical protein